MPLRPTDDGDQPGRPLDDHANATHPGKDENRVRQRADRDDNTHVFTAQPLAQDVGVLRTDRDDERESGAQAREGEQHHSCRAHV